MHWKRWVVITVILAAVVAGIVYSMRPRPVLVEASEAKIAPLRVTVEEEGKTRVTDRYVVSPPVAGYAHRITLKEGDPVQQGQVVTQLEPLRPSVLDPRSRAEAEARVSAAEASLQVAEQRVRGPESDVAYWRTELARVEKLMKTGDVARDRYEKTVNEEKRAAAALREAQEQVSVARSELKAAQATLAYSPATHSQLATELVPVRASVGGRVLKVVRESEGVVNAGEPLIEIGNARSLEVVVELLSADAVKVAPGTRVEFTRWGGDGPLQGVVRKIEPVGFTKISALGVEEQRVVVVADITSPREQWSRLGAGYRVEASFILWQEDKVLQVPSSALFRFEDGWAAFVVDGGFARRRKVEVGKRAGLIAQILSGVSAGDRVISHPDSSIEDGTLVEIRGQATQPPN